MQARGARFSVSSTEAAAPSSVIASSMPSPEPSQYSVGTYQSALTRPTAPRTSCRYSPAGRMPRGPFKPVIWNASDQNAERKINPRARSQIQRGQNTLTMIEVVEGDGKPLAHRQGDSVQGERARDQADAVGSQVLGRHRDEHDEHHAGEEGGAQVHEGQRLAARVVVQAAARAVGIFSVCPPA